MAQDTINCPKCGTEIRISQIFAQGIETEIQQRYEKKMDECKKDELEKTKTRVAKEADQVFARQI